MFDGNPLGQKFGVPPKKLAIQKYQIGVISDNLAT